MLIQILFYVLLLFGVAALAVDMGYVRLTQAQMQNAADTAALEGLRQRDAVDLDACTVSTTDPDQNRRCAAATMAAGLNEGTDIAFKDDPAVNASNESEIRPSHYIDAEGTFTANPTVPQLQTNFESNLRNGDMVSGFYNVPDAACPDSSPHAENAEYCRADFTAAPPATKSTAPSFLVRLRRTSNFKDLDTDLDPCADDKIDNQCGVSSSAPRLPLLFGRVAVMKKAGSWNSLQDGVRVRATAIASGQLVLRVGQPNPAASLPGVAPFALTRAFWESITMDGPQILMMGTDGTIQDNSPVHNTVGQMLIPCNAPLIRDKTCFPAQSVGAPTGNQFASILVGNRGLAYVPVYAPSVADPTLNIVVGFGYLGSVSTAGQTLTIDTRMSGVAPKNASGAPQADANFNTFLQGFTSSLAGGLVAPVIVR